jgi:hypothetical protein
MTSLHASDDLYRSLFSLLICERATIETETGKLWVLIQDRKREIPVEHIDDLEQRGWIELTGEDSVGVTTSGKYWVGRWGKRKGNR